jgi:hypothetical protein
MEILQQDLESYVIRLNSKTSILENRLKICHRKKLNACTCAIKHSLVQVNQRNKSPYLELSKLFSLKVNIWSVCKILLLNLSMVNQILGYYCAFVLCTLCCQFLWIVLFDCPFVLRTLCCQFLWIVLFDCISLSGTQ